MPLPMRLIVCVTLTCALGACAIAPTASPSPPSSERIAEPLKRTAVDPRGPRTDRGIPTTSEAVSSAAQTQADSPQSEPDPDALRKYQTNSKLSVYFERRSAEITKPALATITDNAKRLLADPDLAVKLVGYTDDLSSSSYAVALANRRAFQVADALTKLGVSSRQIRTSSYGQEVPGPQPCATETCRISFRRVDFRYLKLHSNDNASSASISSREH